MLKDALHTLREKENLSQEKFAEMIGVSRQAVQKWETGTAVPELSKVVEISKCFGVSLDALVLGRNRRTTLDELNYRDIKPFYENIDDSVFYASNICCEYMQSVEEGLDIEKYKSLFDAVRKLPKDEIKKRSGRRPAKNRNKRGHKARVQIYRAFDPVRDQSVKKRISAPE